MGLARHSDQERAAVPVLRPGRSRRLQAITSICSRPTPRVTSKKSQRSCCHNSPRWSAAGAIRKCEQRCERMVLRLYAVRNTQKEPPRLFHREARERLALFGSWPSVGRRYRALVMNEHEPRANFDLDDVLKGRLQRSPRRRKDRRLGVAERLIIDASEGGGKRSAQRTR